jgi:hypothetical protein
MTNVFNFLPKGAKSDQSDFMREANDTLEFGENGCSLVSIDVFEKPDDVIPLSADRDWKNQELADLYRVKRMLDAAGVAVDVDRGVTDEGDPWFLFLNAQGDVFIHLCRLDGLYLLDSPNIQEPLRGYDFKALIDGFSKRTVAHASSNNATDHRVIRLERNGKVFLHPSTLLAALIWTLFIAAEELVLIVPEEADALDSRDLDALFTSVKSGPVDLENSILDGMGGQHQDSTPVPAQEAAKDTVEAGGNDLYQRELGSKSIMALSQNSYALGLSTIAIALGFVSESGFLGAHDKILNGLFSDGFETAFATEAKNIDADEGAVQDIVLASIEDVQTVDLTAASTSVEGPRAGLPTTAEHVAGDVIPSKVIVADIALERLIVAQADIELDHQDLSRVTIDTLQPASAVGEAASVDSASQNLSDAKSLSTAIFTELRSALPDEVFEFTFGQTVVHATFDITQAPFLDNGENPVSLLTNNTVTTVKFGDFDSDARAFVDFIFSKSSDLEIISTNHELVIVDTSAFDTPGLDTYALSWSLGDDSGVVSMIGLRSEFEMFHLIA